jgi:hypothetical protein
VDEELKKRQRSRSALTKDTVGTLVRAPADLPGFVIHSDRERCSLSRHKSVIPHADIGGALYANAAACRAYLSAKIFFNGRAKLFVIERPLITRRPGYLQRSRLNRGTDRLLDVGM